MAPWCHRDYTHALQEITETSYKAVVGKMATIGDIGSDIGDTIVSDMAIHLPDSPRFSQILLPPRFISFQIYLNFQI